MLGAFFLSQTDQPNYETPTQKQLELSVSSPEFEGVADFEDPIDETKPDKPDYPTDLTLTLRDGSQVTLADFKDKKAVVLDFWASWCHNCQRNMPAVSAFYGKYKNDVEIIAVNLDESLAKIDKYYNDYKVSYPTAIDPSANQVAQEFGIRYTNTHVLITKDGTVLGPILGDLTEAKLLDLIEA